MINRRVVASLIDGRCGFSKEFVSFAYGNGVLHDLLRRHSSHEACAEALEGAAVGFHLHKRISELKEIDRRCYWTLRDWMDNGKTNFKGAFYDGLYDMLSSVGLGHVYKNLITYLKTINE